MTSLRCHTCSTEYVPCEAEHRLLACAVCETLMVLSLGRLRLVGIPRSWFFDCEAPLDLSVALTACYAELLSVKTHQKALPPRRLDAFGVVLLKIHVAVADYAPDTFGDTDLELEDWRRLAQAAKTLAGVGLARGRSVLAENHPASLGLTGSVPDHRENGPPSSPRRRRTNDACAGCRSRLVAPHSTTWLYECPWCAARVCAACAASRRCPACSDGPNGDARWFLPRRLRLGAAFR